RMGLWWATLLAFLVLVPFVVVYVVKAVQAGPEATPPSAMTAAVVGLSVLVSLLTALTLWTTGKELAALLATRNLRPTVAPGLHFLALLGTAWLVVALGVMQNDINRFRST